MVICYYTAGERERRERDYIILETIAQLKFSCIIYMTNFVITFNYKYHSSFHQAKTRTFLKDHVTVVRSYINYDDLLGVVLL